MQNKWLARGMKLSIAFVIVTTLFWPGAAGAADGELCAATNTLRGQFCESPFAGFANRGQCVAAYNRCLNILPRLMHNWCVQIDQPNCDRNDDCPDESTCYVHAANQGQRQDVKCHQTAKQRWHFSLFDVADCKCDCSRGVFPPPPEGPVAIEISCGDGSLDCSSCTEPSEEEEMCVGESVPWEQRPGANDTPVEPPEPPAKTDTK